MTVLLRGKKTLIQRAIAILRRYGQDAHIYLPGVGMLNGLQAGNYLDSAGTTQGTVDQPVGLVLDAAGGLGVELLQTTGVWWAETGAIGFTTTNSPTSITFTNSGSGSAYASNSPVSVLGKTYNISFTVSGYASGGVAVYIGYLNAGARLTVSANGQYNLKWLVGGNTALYVSPVSAGTTATVTITSVREVTGIHASQPTTANKPILRRGAVNLLTYSGDFSNAAWSAGANGCSATAGLITPLATAALHRVLHTNDFATAGNYTGSVKLKSNGIRYVYINMSATFNLNICVDLNTGAVTNMGGTGITCALQADGYYLVTWNGSFVATGTGVWLQANNAFVATGVSWTPNGTDGFYAKDAAIFQGTYTAQQIQALGGIPLTTTAPASTALGPHWWDTTGGKTLVATFPAGNESVTVIDAVRTGQVTATAQNVVGAYSINTPTSGRFIVNGVIASPELALIQSLANKMAGL